jgi:hypothetical protein
MCRHLKLEALHSEPRQQVIVVQAIRPQASSFAKAFQQRVTACIVGDIPHYFVLNPYFFYLILLNY